MHGLIHTVLKALLDEREPSAWARARARALADMARDVAPVVAPDDTLVRAEQYPDCLSKSLLVATLDELELELADGLRLIGKAHIEHVARAGYLKLLGALGSDVRELMLNLNLLHTNLERSFRRSSMPIFDYRLLADGSSRLSYASDRRGLEYVVEGAVPALAERLYGESILMVPIVPPEGSSAAWQVWVLGRAAVARASEPLASGTPAAPFSPGDVHDALAQLFVTAESSNEQRRTRGAADSPRGSIERSAFDLNAFAHSLPARSPLATVAERAWWRSGVAAGAEAKDPTSHAPRDSWRWPAAALASHGWRGLLSAWRARARASPAPGVVRGGGLPSPRSAVRLARRSRATAMATAVAAELGADVRALAAHEFAHMLEQVEAGTEADADDAGAESGAAPLEFGAAPLESGAGYESPGEDAVFHDTLEVQPPSRTPEAADDDDAAAERARPRAGRARAASAAARGAASVGAAAEDAARGGQDADAAGDVADARPMLAVLSALVLPVLPTRGASWNSAHAAPLHVSPMTSHERAALVRELDVLSALAQRHPTPELLLLRGVHVATVSADWTTPERLPVAASFWAVPNGRLEDYLLSQPIGPCAAGACGAWGTRQRQPAPSPAAPAAPAAPPRAASIDAPCPAGAGAARSAGQATPSWLSPGAPAAAPESGARCPPAAKAPLWFVSHVWSPPEDWDSAIAYAQAKAMEVSFACKDLQAAAECAAGACSAAHAADAGGCSSAPPAPPEPRLWIDKACCPQEHSLLDLCVGQIGGFLGQCDAMIVLCTHNYFSRMWCLFEWGLFLLSRPPSAVHVSAELFLKPENAPRYADAIRRISVMTTAVAVPAQRRVLRALIQRSFVSDAAFERFAQCTAIALLARAAAKRAARGYGYSRLLASFADLASELLFETLAVALRRANPTEWRRTAVESGSALLRLPRARSPPDSPSPPDSAPDSACSSDAEPDAHAARAACSAPAVAHARAPMRSLAGVSAAHDGDGRRMDRTDVVAITASTQPLPARHATFGHFGRANGTADGAPLRTCCRQRARRTAHGTTQQRHGRLCATWDGETCTACAELALRAAEELADPAPPRARSSNASPTVVVRHPVALAARGGAAQRAGAAARARADAVVGAAAVGAAAGLDDVGESTDGEEAPLFVSVGTTLAHERAPPVAETAQRAPRQMADGAPATAWNGGVAPLAHSAALTARTDAVSVRSAHSEQTAPVSAVRVDGGSALPPSTLTARADAVSVRSVRSVRSEHSELTAPVSAVRVDGGSALPPSTHGDNERADGARAAAQLRRAGSAPLLRVDTPHGGDEAVPGTPPVGSSPRAPAAAGAVARPDEHSSAGGDASRAEQAVAGGARAHSREVDAAVGSGVDALDGGAAGSDEPAHRERRARASTGCAPRRAPPTRTAAEAASAATIEAVVAELGRPSRSASPTVSGRRRPRKSAPRRSVCAPGTPSGGVDSWHDTYMQHVDAWFAADVEPLLLKLREHVVRRACASQAGAGAQPEKGAKERLPFGGRAGNGRRASGAGEVGRAFELRFGGAGKQMSRSCRWLRSADAPARQSA